MKKSVLMKTFKDVDDLFRPLLRNPVDARTSTSKHNNFLEYYARRSDSIHELLSIQVDSSGGKVFLYMQLAVHYFSECPVPAGPFGRDGNFVQIMLKSGLEVPNAILVGEALQWDGQSRMFLKKAFEDIRRLLLAKCDEWALLLKSDPILARLAWLSEEIRNRKASDWDAERLADAVKEFGKVTANGYPVSKVANQAFLRGIWDPKWSLV